jgi:hypothetical protein
MSFVICQWLVLDTSSKSLDTAFKAANFGHVE